MRIHINKLYVIVHIKTVTVITFMLTETAYSHNFKVIGKRKGAPKHVISHNSIPLVNSGMTEESYHKFSNYI